MTSSVLIKNCRSIITQDPQRRILEGYDILVEDDRIKKIAKGIKGANIIDGRDRIVMPGLVNTHTHYGMQLLRGVCDDEQLARWLSLVIPLEKKLTAADLKKSAELACTEMLLSGTTTFADMYSPIEPLADIVETFGLRAVLFPVVQDQLEHGSVSVAAVERLIKQRESNHRIRFGIGAHSIYGCSPKQLTEVMGLAKKHKLLKAMHIAETRKERFDCQKTNGKLPVEYLESIGFLDKNTLLIHAIWLTKGEVNLLGKYGTSVSHCPVSNMKLASGGVMPLPEMIGAGVTVGLGTDSVVSNNNLDLFEEMKLTGLLHKHHRWDATVAPLQLILDMATINGAKALGMDADVGSLEEGKKADIIMLDVTSPHHQPINNVLSNIVYAARGSDVKEVLVDGKILVREGKRWA